MEETRSYVNVGQSSKRVSAGTLRSELQRCTSTAVKLVFQAVVGVIRAAKINRIYGHILTRCAANLAPGITCRDSWSQLHIPFQGFGQRNLDRIL